MFLSVSTQAFPLLSGGVTNSLRIDKRLVVHKPHSAFMSPTTHAYRQAGAELMPYHLRWTGPAGVAHRATVETTKAAQMKRAELLGEGFAGVEIRDDAGKKLDAYALYNLMALEERKD